MTKLKEASTNNENRKYLEGKCPEVYASKIISGQWTLAICCYLIKGQLRFSEIKKSLPKITDRMLTLELRKLEKKGLVKRTIIAEVPAKVEYQLTSIGKELSSIINELGIWGEKHKKLNSKIAG
ncbi:helix-turn-helix domain-containing protein [Aquimarina gracilis]|uniref:Helix-turn-helix domain-containing protein n=1 Tax=Aquimarina gracilis TaxID=874422 RepID=A0ABU5ZRR1_9FLAO|nr:helix-turn-helix domain-containing protein [Aquimarina gracilis]MEB3344745.1 helix-turn-helix domain-containing protein [Aquimarina gracilis]